MRFVWLVFAGLAALMVLVLPRLGHRAAAPAAATSPAPTDGSASTLPVKETSSFAALREAPARAAQADSVVAFGLAQRGTPYVFAGTSPLTGFDCSGFIMYTFAHFGVAVPHSTALLIDVGRPVARADAQPGDIVVFTGTAATSSTPGHAGIVISRRGELPLRFVHASSSRREHFVKVSQVEGSDYERRFMQVRRVLGAGPLATARPLPAPVAPRKAPVSALPVHPVEVAAADAAPAAPPKTLPTKKYPAHASPKKHAVTIKPVAKAKATSKPAPVRKKGSTGKAAPKPRVQHKAPVKKATVKTTHPAKTRGRAQ